MRSVRRAFDAAAALRRPVLVPAVVLAELYRGPGRNARVDSCLSRESRAIDVRDTDRSFARYVGGVLAAAGAGSEVMADAPVGAAAVDGGGAHCSHSGSRRYWSTGRGVSQRGRRGDLSSHQWSRRRSEEKAPAQSTVPYCPSRTPQAVAEHAQYDNVHDGSSCPRSREHTGDGISSITGRQNG